MKVGRFGVGNRKHRVQDEAREFHFTGGERCVDNLLESNT